MDKSSDSRTIVMRVRHLCTDYVTRAGTVNAVRDVSFDLKEGEKFGLVGESGSGKSALALSMLGLIEPPGRIAGGEVWLGQSDLTTLSDRVMGTIRGARLAAIFQDPMTSLDPVKTIGSQVGEAIERHQRQLSRREVRDRVVSLLQEVEITSPLRRLKAYPHELSGGMRQRVMLATALANEPEVLIADEPTTALDVTTQAQMLELMERLVDRRRTAIILITHNLGIVAGFCETVQVMYAGRIVESGDVRGVFERPGHPYTEALLQAVVRPGPESRKAPLPTIPGSPPNPVSLPNGCAFEPRCFLGRDKDICVGVSPPPYVIQRRVVECHFARERVDDAPSHSRNG